MSILGDLVGLLLRISERKLSSVHRRERKAQSCRIDFYFTAAAQRAQRFRSAGSLRVFPPSSSPPSSPQYYGCSIINYSLLIINSPRLFHY